MRKITIALFLALILSACSGDALINRNYLGKNYNTSTKSVDLSDMSLTKIPDFSQYGTGEVFFWATSIDISGNNIETIDMSAFSRFSGLRELNMSDNSIKRINQLETDMDVLNLSNNQLESIKFASGAILRDLYLSWNTLKFGNDLQDLPTTLLRLDVANNTLENIDGFGQLLRLKYLDVSGNILTDEDLIELKGRNNIKFLDIAKNPEMSQQRVESLESFNQIYIDANTFKTRTESTMSGALTQ